MPERHWMWHSKTETKEKNEYFLSVESELISKPHQASPFKNIKKRKRKTGLKDFAYHRHVRDLGERA